MTDWKRENTGSLARVGSMQLSLGERERERKGKRAEPVIMVYTPSPEVEDGVEDGWCTVLKWLYDHTEPYTQVT